VPPFINRALDCDLCSVGENRGVSFSSEPVSSSSGALPKPSRSPHCKGHSSLAPCLLHDHSRVVTCLDQWSFSPTWLSTMVYTLSTMNRLSDLSKRKFGRWSPVWPAGIRGSVTHWLCFCACGKFRAISSTSLTRRLSRSCGCLRDEKAPMNLRVQVKHGHTKFHGKNSATYVSWIAMKTRCLNPKATHYEDYGGRGIRVCRRWLRSFPNFLADMGEKPTRWHTLDRIRNSGHYRPSNCRWATRKEQAQHRRPKKRRDI
jgi:hypothetical protein